MNKILIFPYTMILFGCLFLAVENVEVEGKLILIYFFFII
jgi:hypothetical protein